jgi:pimeloyl-ACP methyl ester carboxylesterase
MADIAVRLNVRLIAVDRPGFGLSDAKHGRTLLGWADDVAALVDALGIDRFALIGFSMGTTYALACAYKLPQRLSKVALAGALISLDTAEARNSMPPTVGALYELAQTNPLELTNVLTAIAATPPTLFATMTSAVSACDKPILNARRAEFETEFQETLRSGLAGMISDIVINAQSWGFPIDTIKTEVHLWSGTEDSNTPPAMTAYFSSVLPNSQTFALQGEGHYALYRHWEEILARLV